MKQDPMKVVATRVPADVARQLREQAKRDDRIFAGYLRRVLTAAAERESDGAEE